MRKDKHLRNDLHRYSDGRLFLNVTLIFSVIFAGTCDQKSPVAETANANAPVVQPSISPEVSSSVEPVKHDASREVEFKGVKVRNFISLVSAIETEERPAAPLEDETHKPDYVESRSIALKFSESINQPGYEASIRIYPVDEFRQAFAIQPGYGKGFDKDLNSLKEFIARKTAKKENLPELHFYEGHPAIAARFKPIVFKNGNGVLFLEQWAIDHAVMINNQELFALFQGLTNDGKYYVRAQFPIALEGLPDNETGDFEGYNANDYYSDAQSKQAEARYEKYLRTVEKLLNQSAPEKFTPNLNEIEKTISSLEVKWQIN